MRSPARVAAALVGLWAGAAAPAFASTRCATEAAHEVIGASVAFLRQLLRSDSTEVAEDHVVTLAGSQAAVTFQFEHRPSLKLSFADGRVYVDGTEAGRYELGGPLEQAWRRLLLEASTRSTAEAVALLQHWAPRGLADDEARMAAALAARVARLDVVVAGPTPQALAPAGAEGPTLDLSDLSRPEQLEPTLSRVAATAGPTQRVTVPGGQARLGDFRVAPGETVTGPVLVLKGNADIHGRVAGNLVTVDGDIVVHPGGTVAGDVLAIGGEVRHAMGTVTGEVRTLSAVRPGAAAAAAPAITPGKRVGVSLVGLVGVALSLLLLGYGAAVFAPGPLGIVADTVRHSFLRAFAAGLLGQVLLLPTFGIIVAGLVLTVIGVLLVPFAAVVYGLVAAVALVGGYLAVAHALGETWVRRRMAAGVLTTPSSIRYLTAGLVAALSLWVTWALFGWSPAMARVLLGLAALATWFLATAGFGAMLLSRAGMKEHFAGRFIPPEALTDEYLWATPRFGVPAVKRPGTAAPRREAEPEHEPARGHERDAGR